MLINLLPKPKPHHINPIYFAVVLIVFLSVAATSLSTDTNTPFPSAPLPTFDYNGFLPIPTAVKINMKIPKEEVYDIVIDPSINAPVFLATDKQRIFLHRCTTFKCNVINSTQVVFPGFPTDTIFAIDINSDETGRISGALLATSQPGSLMSDVFLFTCNNDNKLCDTPQVVVIDPGHNGLRRIQTARLNTGWAVAVCGGSISNLNCSTISCVNADCSSHIVKIYPGDSFKPIYNIGYFDSFYDSETGNYTFFQAFVRYDSALPSSTIFFRDDFESSLSEALTSNLFAPHLYSVTRNSVNSSISYILLRDSGGNDLRIVTCSNPTCTTFSISGRITKQTEGINLLNNPVLLSAYSSDNWGLPAIIGDIDLFPTIISCQRLDCAQNPLAYTLHPDLMENKAKVVKLSENLVSYYTKVLSEPIEWFPSIQRIKPADNCQDSKFLDLLTIPPQCSICPIPIIVNAQNPFPNKNTSCIGYTFPECPNGYKATYSYTVNAPFQGDCEICPNTNASGSYNPKYTLNMRECLWEAEEDCLSGEFVDLVGPLSDCLACLDATTLGAYNIDPSRNTTCVFEPHRNCSSHHFTNLYPPAPRTNCLTCPSASPAGSFNPFPNNFTGCALYPFDLCPPHEFLDLLGLNGECSQCPPASKLGEYNPVSSLNTSCTFHFSPDQSCKNSETLSFDDNNTPVCVRKHNPESFDSSTVYGGIGVSVSLMAFVGFRWRKALKRRSVEYRDIVSFAPAVASTFSSSDDQRSVFTKQDYIINVLSLDGGGIRGLALVQMLQKIEETIQVEIPHIFHLIGGTSTGGLLALGISHKFCLSECQQLYSSLGSKIFKTSVRIPLIRVLKQVFGNSLYSGNIFEDILKDIFGEKLLYKNPLHDDESILHDDEFSQYIASEAKNRGSFEDPYQNCYPLSFGVSTLVSVDPPIEYLFRSYMLPEESNAYAGTTPDENWTLWEATRATSAAPIFFPEFARPKREGIHTTGRLWADGALYHNNPGRVVLSEANAIWPGAKFSLFLSLGTGVIDSEGGNSTVKKGQSSLGWAKTLASIVTNSERAHHELIATLPPECYFRFNPPFSTPIPLDASSNVELELLTLTTESYLHSDEISAQINSLVNRVKNLWTHLNPPLAMNNSPASNLLHVESTIQLAEGIFPSSSTNSELSTARSRICNLENQLFTAQSQLAALKESNLSLSNNVKSSRDEISRLCNLLSERDN